MGAMHGPGVSGGLTHIPSRRTGFSSRGPFMHEGFRGDRFRGDRFRHDRFRHFRFRNCFGFGCWGGYPWAYAYYDPWWWWDSGSNYDEDYDRDRLYAEQMNWQDLEEQRMLRQEEEAAERDREASTRTAPVPAPREEKESAAVLPATVLVFRDQHKREVDNYAIVGQTLWAFAAQRTEKIPLADLDLAATTKANDDRGLTFRVPSANEGQ
jgi:hypothetical protein